MRIIFVRHGDPNYRLDCLTEKGEEQAALAAERLADEGISEIFASSMGRAQKTASYTAEKLGLPITSLDYMREIDWGDADGGELKNNGHPWSLGCEMIEDQDFEFTLTNWREHPYFKNNIATRYYDEISEKIDGFLAGHGYERKGTRYLCTKGTDKTIALFSHGGSGACALSHILNMPFPYVCAVLPYDFTSLVILNFPGDEGKIVFPRVELFNDVRHTRIDKGFGPVFGR